FASNKDRDNPEEELHTNFRLSRNGEFLALVAQDGNTIVHSYSPAYPQQYPDIAYGIGTMALSTDLINSNNSIRAFVPSDGSLSNAWTQLPFDDSSWLSGMPGVGFDLGPTFDPLIQLDIEATMQSVNPTAYLRLPFTVADASAVHSLRLNMQYDDGFIAYLNGQEVVSRNTSDPSAGGDRMISYTVFDDANGTALTGITMDRGGRRYVYPTHQLIGIQLIHFKAGTAVNNVVANSTPAPANGNRHVVIDGDVLLNTGSINPGGAGSPPASDPVIDNVTPANSTPGMAVVFDKALTNSVGDDLVLFELHNAGTGNGDSFHVMPLTGLGGGLSAHTVAAYDITMNDASPIATFQQFTFSPSPQSIDLFETQALNTGAVSSGFKAPATGIDLSDMGVPMGGSVTGLFFMAVGPNGGIDPVFIAGLPPASAESDEWRLSANSDRPDASALSAETIDLTSDVDVLITGTNLLAIHGMSSGSNDSDFVISPQLQLETRTFDTGVVQYFTATTPGLPNAPGSAVLGPFILDVTDERPLLNTNFTITVTAEVAETTFSLQRVDLFYRIMFNGEVTVPMRDDGISPDALAGDGLFTARFSGTLNPGEMVRWRYEAEDTDNRISREPPFLDPLDADEYFGTMADDPATNSSLLPVVHWFVEDPAAANTLAGTRGSLYFLGDFYDNILADRHGQSSGGFPKKSYDLDFNRGNRFKWKRGEGRVKDINLLTNWADKSKVRNTLGYETVALAGAPSHFAFPVRVQQNATFFSVADMVEDGDDDSLERNGLDPNGAFYKMYNRLDTAASGAEKKTRKDEDASDLQALIDGLTTGSALEQRQYAYDHVDIAQAANYYAVQSIYGNHDWGHKNYYMYRDTEGDGEWYPITWDVDLSFGHLWNPVDFYFNDELHPDNGVNIGVGNNRLRQDLYAYPAFYEMFTRRLRTLMDDILQPPGTPVEDRYYERRYDEIADLIDPAHTLSDAELDYAQ
ncbi:MAG: CotH kinase family protein, partial [Verrucomicrobiota bacterium]